MTTSATHPGTDRDENPSRASATDSADTELRNSQSTYSGGCTLLPMLLVVLALILTGCAGEASAIQSSEDIGQLVEPTPTVEWQVEDFQHTVAYSNLGQWLLYIQGKLEEMEASIAVIDERVAAPVVPLVYETPIRETLLLAWLNGATTQGLMVLPGIGVTLAQRIEEARPLAHVNDLLDIDGIGEVTVRNMLLTVQSCFPDASEEYDCE